MEILGRSLLMVALVATAAFPILAQSTPDFFATVAKVVSYEQRPDGAPVYQGHSFFFDLQHWDGSSALQDVDYVNLTPSTGESFEYPWGSLTLPFIRDFESEALLDASFPDDEYFLAGRLFLGGLESEEWSAWADFGPGDYLPAPTITNLAGLQALSTNEVVRILWTRIPQYSTSRHSVRVSIIDDQTGEPIGREDTPWYSSDDRAEFNPAFLNIPVKQLPGRRLRASVYFRDTTSSIDVEEARMRLVLRRTSVTSFYLQFADSSAPLVLPTPVITLPDAGQSGSGTIEFRLTLAPGTTAELQEGSSLSQWVTVSSATASATGTVKLSAPLPVESNVRFYRVKTR